MDFKRILVAVDAGPVAAHAADAAAGLARALHAELAYVTVVDPVAISAPDSGVPGADLLAIARRDSERLLAHLQGRVTDGPPPLAFLVVGKPASQIVKTAKEWPADVIVIGSHGRHGVDRVLLGSVAEGVMRRAPCPVLVVRAPE